MKLSEARTMRREFYGPYRHARQIARDALPGVLFALLIVAVYTVVQTVEENRELRRVAAVKAKKMCPDRVGGLVFLHSRFTKLDASRPARLSCYYSRGVKS